VSCDTIACRAETWSSPVQFQQRFQNSIWHQSLGMPKNESIKEVDVAIIHQMLTHASLPFTVLPFLFCFPYAACYGMVCP
jgi:hypothetical protein